ncbi:twitching motility protein PilT [miscellaneous Crenarchaeota group archaeon SMTZ-80]|nr:MAG: twitching motility protein PilT [miscellaneous Crenarchaeota group archaeon SMTZ-80]
MYLIDTSIILELLLDQEKADEVERFLRVTPSEKLYLSEFALYSLGVVLLRRKMHDIFLRSVNDLLLNGGIQLIRLGFKDMQDIVHVSGRFNLDFDDAYQYIAAEKYSLTIVSFDSDFDRTERGGKTPEQVLRGRL